MCCTMYLLTTKILGASCSHNLSKSTRAISFHPETVCALNLDGIDLLSVELIRTNRAGSLRWGSHPWHLRCHAACCSLSSESLLHRVKTAFDLADPNIL